MPARFERLLLSDEGATAVEMAFIFPAVLLVLLGIFEFGRVLYTQGMLNYAAEAAARCGATDLNNCPNYSSTKSYASAAASPLTIPTSDFTVSTLTGGVSATLCGGASGSSVSGTFIQVSASHAFDWAVPQLFPSLTLTAQSCYPSTMPGGTQTS